MSRIRVPFAAGFYVSQAIDLVNKRLVNMYPQIPQSGALNQRALFGAPGITQFAVVADNGGPSRGSIRFPNLTPYFVIQNDLISLNQFGAVTFHGTITGVDEVSIATNGINICIVDPNGDSFFFTPETDTLEKITDPAFLSFGQARTVAFKDGYYVFTTDELFFVSSLKTENDGKNFNALDFADSESSPDRIVKGHNNHNQLYILNRDTIEVFQTVATGGFPFQRITGAQIQKGCAAAKTVVEFDNTFVFLGGDINDLPSLWRTLGSSPQRISTSSIDQLVHKQSPEDIANASCFPWALAGNVYLTFRIGPHTFVYDSTASALAGSPQWHERQTGINRGEDFQLWRAVHGVQAFGKILVGDDRSSQVGELSFTEFQEYGEPIERIASTQPLTELGEYIFSYEVEGVFQTGETDSYTEGPIVLFDYSDQGGRAGSFSQESPRTLGGQGQYELRVRWPRLGRIPTDRVLRWRYTDEGPFNILAVYANAEVVSSG